MDVSFIIPSYRSNQILVKQLPELIQWIRLNNLEAEIIVVVDGEDIEMYAEIANLPFVVLIGYPINEGKGFAIKFGFNVAKAPLVIYTDADIPYDGNTISTMFQTLQKHKNAEVWVIGDRTLPGSVYFDNIPWLRKLGSDFFLLIIRHTLGDQFADTQCGLKGFNRHAGEVIFERSVIKRFAFDFECLFIARKLKMPVIKIPVVLRNQSPSTVRVVRDGIKLLKDVSKVIFINKYD